MKVGAVGVGVSVVDHSTAYSHLGGRRGRPKQQKSSTPSTQMTVGCGMVWLARLEFQYCGVHSVLMHDCMHFFLMSSKL